MIIFLKMTLLLERSSSTPISRTSPISLWNDFKKGKGEQNKVFSTVYVSVYRRWRENEIIPVYSGRTRRVMKNHKQKDVDE